MHLSPKAKWFLFSIAGLLLTGLGLSLAIDAGVKKFNHQAWYVQGTLALIIFNGGLSVFGRAIAEYVWMRRK